LTARAPATAGGYSLPCLPRICGAADLVNPALAAERSTGMRSLDLDPSDREMLATELERADELERDLA
jgi:hypothetical protein